MSDRSAGKRQNTWVVVSQGIDATVFIGDKIAYKIRIATSLSGRGETRAVYNERGI
jgi:hypothetical protein